METIIQYREEIRVKLKKKFHTHTERVLAGCFVLFCFKDEG